MALTFNPKDPFQVLNESLGAGYYGGDSGPEGTTQAGYYTNPDSIFRQYVENPWRSATLADMQTGGKLNDDFTKLVGMAGGDVRGALWNLDPTLGRDPSRADSLLAGTQWAAQPVSQQLAQTQKFHDASDASLQGTTLGSIFGSPEFLMFAGAAGGNALAGGGTAGSASTGGTAAPATSAFEASLPQSWEAASALPSSGPGGYLGTAGLSTPALDAIAGGGLAGAVAGSATASGGATTPPAGGTKMDFFDNWDLMNGTTDTAIPDPTVSYQDPNVMDMPLPDGSGGGLQSALMRILGGGALGPELRRALGLPEPAAGGTGGTSLYDMIGRIAPAALGYKAATNQTAAYKDLADKYMGFGAPSRARFEGSFAPGFTMASEPGYKDAMDQAAQATLRKMSATGGNPFGNPSAWAQTLKDVNSNFAYPALQNYRAQNAGAGGLAALTAAAPGAASGAINSQANAYGAVGGGLADVFNPPKSLAEILKQMGGGGGGGFKFSLA